jgi:hypothetical protein
VTRENVPGGHHERRVSLQVGTSSNEPNLEDGVAELAEPFGLDANVS